MKFDPALHRVMECDTWGNKFFSHGSSIKSYISVKRKYPDVGAIFYLTSAIHTTEAYMDNSMIPKYVLSIHGIDRDVDIFEHRLDKMIEGSIGFCIVIGMDDQIYVGVETECDYMKVQMLL